MVYRHPVDWLNTPGEFVRHDERRLLYELAEYVTGVFDIPTIVNIGISLGASLHCLYAGAPDANHIAIDIDFKQRPFQGAEALSDVTLIEMDSNQYKPKEPIHLVFVDGSHDYVAVKGDIGAFVSHIPINGIVAFHDYAPIPRDQRRLIGVKQAIDEWRKSVGDAWQLRWSADSIVAYQRVK